MRCSTLHTLKKGHGAGDDDNSVEDDAQVQIERLRLVQAVRDVAKHAGCHQEEHELVRELQTYTGVPQNLSIVMWWEKYYSGAAPADRPPAQLGSRENYCALSTLPG